jgi:drug/metabolite transporter (DMT)-like permease
MAAIVACVLLFGFSSLFEKLALNEVPLQPFVFMRFVLAAALVAGVMIIIEVARRGDAGRLLRDAGTKAVANKWSLLAVVTLCAGSVLYYHLLAHKTSTAMLVLWPAMMAVGVLLAHIFLKERLRPLQWLGVALAFIGGALVHCTT